MLDEHRRIAIDLVRQALALIDEHGFGSFAAPHLDHGLALLEREAARIQPDLVAQFAD